MTNKRKIVDARADENGNISAVKLEGNSTFTSINKAKEMTRNGHIDAVYVKATRNTIDHLRQPPNKRQCDNLDDMAGQ